MQAYFLGHPGPPPAIPVYQGELTPAQIRRLTPVELSALLYVLEPHQLSYISDEQLDNLSTKQRDFVLSHRPSQD